MKIADLHKRQSEPFIYCGRFAPHTKHGYIGRSYLANRYAPTITKSVAECLLQYRRWLFQKIQEGDYNVMASFREIKEDSTLACWCCERSGAAVFEEPLVCHTQLIWRAWRWLREKDNA